LEIKIPTNVVLVGFMGSGKTTTGKELSKLLDYHFFDMDEWIEEKNGMKTWKIFSEKGEDYFRSQESEAILGLMAKTGYVISAGGGVWLKDANRKILTGLGMCIWLKVSPQEAWERISSNLEQRPLLNTSKDPFGQLENILEKRSPVYSLAPLSVDTKGKKPKDVALEIFGLLKGL
jgi:shikimate kinase